MGMDKRQIAYEQLIVLAERQGYVTFDNIMDCADEHSLSIQDFDWLSDSITTRGILVYNEVPSHTILSEDDEYDDYAQSDYESVYNQIIALSPSLSPFISFVKSVVPPQRGEIKQLKYQIVDGNKFARDRMIEMHLRLALRVALQRAETYDMDIEDTVGDACVGLVTAVDKYDPDKSGAFAQYAALWILQNISREQSTQRSLISYPSHRKEDYFTIYPVLKSRGCIGCDKFIICGEAKKIIIEAIGCSDRIANELMQQMVPDERICECFNLNSDTVTEHYPKSLNFDNIDSYENTVVPENIVLYSILKEEISSVLHTLTPREEAILRIRFGLDDGCSRTLEEIGNMLEITRERIRQIEAKALRKLRHPSRSKRLRDFIDL